MTGEEDEPGALEEQLVRERAARLAAERELAGLQAQKRHLESRAITARHTLAYGLGRALIEARSLKGLLRLPSRIRRLRLRQKAKRKLRVPDTVPANLARRMRLVEETLDRAGRDGVGAARNWLKGRDDRQGRARALAELGIWAAERGDEASDEIALEAARSAPEEPRLLALIARLHDNGKVRVPAAMGRLAIAAQPMSAPQRAWIETLLEDADLLDRGDKDGTDSVGARGARPSPAIKGVALIAPERWRRAPRLIAAGEAATAAGLDELTALPDDAEAVAVHIFADSLDFAEAALGKAAGAGTIILDFAGRPPALNGDRKSETARAAIARLTRMVGAADHTIARGPAAKDMVESVGRECVDIDDCWPVSICDEKETEVARAEFGIGGEESTIAVFVDFGRGAGLEQLLQAFRKLVAEHGRGELVILGQGPAMPGLDQLIAAYGLEQRVTFLGMPAFERWPAILSACEAVIFPSAEELSLGSLVPMAMPLAASLGLPTLYADGAWASRTSGALPPRSFGEDWTASIAGALRQPLAPETQHDGGLGRLYDTLRKV